MRVVIAGLIASALLSGARAEDAPAQAPEPWLGTWKLRVEKGAPAMSEVVRFEPVDGGYRSIHDSVGPDGKPSHLEYFARPDGKDYPLKPGSPMAVRVKKVDDHTIDWWTLKDGVIVVSGRSVHSRDGKTKTMTFTRTNEKGEKVETTKIYDRQPGHVPRSTVLDFAATPSIERLRAVKFLPVPATVTGHAVEERGFVSVPMDYARRSESPTLRIFYRLMPARGAKPRESRAPILVVVNGGPAMASSRLRPYDYDQDRPTEEMRKGDRLGELLSRYRVLLLDQRGTGHSSPLDMSDPLVDPAVVARYFDSAHIALDHQEVIRAVIPEGEPFYMVLHSYAGMIGMRYMTLPGISRLPRGLVFASAVLPHRDVVQGFAARRSSQRALNLDLVRPVPDFKESIARLRAHFGANGMDPGSVNYLWTWLGKGVAGQWETALRDQVNVLLAADRGGLETFVESEADRADLLNYILSAKELTPGFTDRTLGALLVKQVPFEEWMLDEDWTSTRLRGDAGWIDPLLDAIDRNPPPESPAFPPIDEIRRRLAGLHALFLFGRGDAYVAEETGVARARRYAVDGRSRIEVLPGGHRAVFLAPGVETIASWIASLPPPDTTRQDR